MNAKETKRPQGGYCYNVMEALVNAEIEQQLMHLPLHLKKYINKVEVMTYAMNRLPALYASSEKGRQHQMSRAQQELGKQVTIVVRRALAAVQRDPLRVATPLKPPEESESEAALQKLKELLQNEKLNWTNILPIIEQTLVKTSQGEISWKFTPVSQSKYNSIEDRFWV